MQTKKNIRDFLPLIIIFSCIFLYTIIRLIQHGAWDTLFVMRNFEGAFFIIFGAFKLLNWRGFVSAYQLYDIIARRSKPYAYAYPIIELALGIAYLAAYQLLLTSIITFLIMVVSTIGVAQALSKKQAISCACLGTVFKLPMTQVTLVEDLLMGVMALVMIFLAV